jgi:hypothetical protein
MTTAFERRIERVISHQGSRWAAHLVDVIDTAEAVRLGIRQWNEGKEPSDQLLLGLTTLVLEREAAERHLIEAKASETAFLGRREASKP